MRFQDIVSFVANNSTPDIVAWARTADYFARNAAVVAAAQTGNIDAVHALAAASTNSLSNPQLYGEVLVAVCSCKTLSADDTLAHVHWLLQAQKATPDTRYSAALCAAIDTHKYAVIDILLPFCARLHYTNVLKSAVAANNIDVVQHLLGRTDHPIERMDTVVAHAVERHHFGMAEQLLGWRKDNDVDFPHTLQMCVDHRLSFLGVVFAHCSAGSVDHAVASFSSRFLYPKADALIKAYAQWTTAQKEHLALTQALTDFSFAKTMGKRM